MVIFMTGIPGKNKNLPRSRRAAPSRELNSSVDSEAGVPIGHNTANK